MTKQSNQHEVSGGGDQEDCGEKAVSVRLWPAAISALIHIVAALVFRFFGTTVIENGIALGGIPLISTILFVLWWLVWSRVPMRSRLLGLVLFSVTVALIVFSQQPTWLGALGVRERTEQHVRLPCAVHVQLQI
jgi:hypothetical protein